VNTLTGNCGVREFDCFLLARRGPCLRVEEYTPRTKSVRLRLRISFV